MVKFQEKTMKNTSQSNTSKLKKILAMLSSHILTL